MGTAAASAFDLLLIIAYPFALTRAGLQPLPTECPATEQAQTTNNLL
ncbi:hypothetical protein ART_2095 [Arthrobacter sp. PAMC 25486]|nr:hypothetical protein ART_2095 [Arthrobacter sp. PAMC 25486]